MMTLTRYVETHLHHVAWEGRRADALEAPEPEEKALRVAMRAAHDTCQVMMPDE